MINLVKEYLGKSLPWIGAKIQLDRITADKVITITEAVQMAAIYASIENRNRAPDDQIRIELGDAGLNNLAASAANLAAQQVAAMFDRWGDEDPLIIPQVNNSGSQ